MMKLDLGPHHYVIHINLVLQTVTTQDLAMNNVHDLLSVFLNLAVSLCLVIARLVPWKQLRDIPNLYTTVSYLDDGGLCGLGHGL